MHPISPHRKRTAALTLACALLLGLSAAAFATETPDQGPATTAPPTASESLIAPEIATPLLTPTEGVLLLRWNDTADPDGRISSYTDLGLGVPYAGPNALERAKLEQARTAIEASRAAGTLMMAGEAIGVDRALLQALESRRFETNESSAPSPDAAAGVGPEIEGISRVGHEGLNEVERAKLAGEIPVDKAAETATEEKKETRQEADVPTQDGKGETR